MLETGGHTVHGILTIDDLGQGVGGGAEAWVIDEDVVAGVAGGQHPMTAVVHVADHDVAGVEVGLDLAVREFPWG